MEFDLEHFPDSTSAKRMMSRVSPIYERSYVAKWLYQAMGLEWDAVWIVMDSMWMQPFLAQATWALRYWEQAYGLDTDESKTYAERRRAVASKRSQKAPLNPARLETMIRTTFGCDAVVAENVAPYTFQVTLADASQWMEITQWLKRIKPSHLTVQFVQVSQSVSFQCGAGAYLQIYEQIQAEAMMYPPQEVTALPLYIGAGAYPQIYQQIQSETANAQ